MEITTLHGNLNMKRLLVPLLLFNKSVFRDRLLF